MNVLYKSSLIRVTSSRIAGQSVTAGVRTALRIYPEDADPHIKTLKRSRKRILSSLMGLLTTQALRLRAPNFS